MLRENSPSKCLDICDLDAQVICEKINDKWQHFGLQVYAFNIGWYNSQVRNQFSLNYHDDTLAFTIISLPEMFEEAFIPFLSSRKCDISNLSAKDPLDQCMMHHFSQLNTMFPNYNLKFIHDFEMHQNRRPKVLVQTAGHVSGAAYYYQSSDVKNSPWTSKQKIYGVSIHPEYGGWFALRGIVIFQNVRCSNLTRAAPKDVLGTDELKIKLLEDFNYEWQNWKYRDIIPVRRKYSEKQMQYFSTLPADRFRLLNSFVESSDIT